MVTVTGLPGSHDAGWWGTSFAAPLAAGLGDLMCAKRANPGSCGGWDRELVIKNTSRPYPTDCTGPGLQRGRIDFYEALLQY
jgi:hypothetical protein